MTMGDTVPIHALGRLAMRVREAFAIMYGPLPAKNASGCHYCNTRQRTPDSLYCSPECENDAEGFSALP